MKPREIALEAARIDLELSVAARTQELMKANEELRERDDRHRQFFADIGHELRTTVTAICGEAEVALRAKSNTQASQEAALKTIVTLSEELTSYVGDPFLSAREQTGVLDFRTDLIDLGQSAALCTEQIQSLKAKQGA